MAQKIKYGLPSGVRFFLHWVFKSRQREYTGWRSLWNDLRAIMRYKYGAHDPAGDFTICTAISGRKNHLLQYLLASAAAADRSERIHISLFHCAKTRDEDVLNMLETHFSGRYIYCWEDVPFARSTCFNRAVRHSFTDKVLIIDADISMPKDIVKAMSRAVAPGRAWFPVCWNLPKGVNFYDPQQGNWLYSGLGTLGTTCADFHKAGGLHTGYKEWGGEDAELFREYYLHNIWCLRTRHPVFLHHWHPSLKPEEYEEKLLPR